MLLTMSGCIKEDLSDCDISGNVRLVFHYTVAGVEKLTDHIQHLDVMFFDDQGKFLMDKRLGSQELAVKAELELTLAPGTYYFVCWGNVSDGSLYSSLEPGITVLSDCSIEISPGPTAGDPIYYAPSKPTPASRTLASEYELYKLEIPVGENVVRDVEFVKAHRTITVYLKNAHGDTPKVQVRQMWKCYNFLFEPRTHKDDFTHITTPRQYFGDVYDVAIFYSGMGQILPDMEVGVLHGTNEHLLHTENIESFLTAHPSHDANDIHMVIEFSDLGVSVTVPSWLERPVTPGAH